MKVIEEFIEGKYTNPGKCEDGIFVNEHFAAVVDGATSKSDLLWDGQSSGQMAKDLIISALSTTPFNVTPKDMMISLNEAFKKYYIEKNLFEKMRDNPIDRFTAGGLVIYSNHKHEIWFVGDCKAMIDGKSISNDKFVDELFNELRAFYLESEILEGKTTEELLEHDTGREIIQPFIKRQTKFQNLKLDNKFIFSVIDGFFNGSSSIKTVPVPDDTKEIVLASDGYPQLHPTLSKSEENLKTILAQDPLLFRKFKSTKGLESGNNSFDDRAYVRLALQ